ncbi:MAG: porin, partial [Candidatus Hydrogenedentota bacterium]
PIEGLEVGVSYGVDGVGGAGGSQDRNTLGVDASYSFGAIGLRGEWIKVSEDPTGQPVTSKTEAKGFYVEAQYDYNSKISFGARYSDVSTEQGALTSRRNKFSTIAVTGAYRLADNVIVKAEYDLNNESELGGGNVTFNGTRINEIDNDVFALSLVGSF